MTEYADMLHMKRPPSGHPAMPEAERAAQFSPFAALSGLGMAMEETEAMHVSEVEHEIETDPKDYSS